MEAVEVAVDKVVSLHHSKPYMQVFMSKVVNWGKRKANSFPIPPQAMQSTDSAQRKIHIPAVVFLQRLLRVHLWVRVKEVKNKTHQEYFFERN